MNITMKQDFPCDPGHLSINATPNQSLDDDALERVLRAAFAPHRCSVRFQQDAFSGVRKVALTIRIASSAPRIPEREFVVEGVAVETLRTAEALAEYVGDVRRQLARRRVVFVTTKADATTLAREHVPERPTPTRVGRD